MLKKIVYSVLISTVVISTLLLIVYLKPWLSMNVSFNFGSGSVSESNTGNSSYNVIIVMLTILALIIAITTILLTFLAFKTSEGIREDARKIAKKEVQNQLRIEFDKLPTLVSTEIVRIMPTLVDMIKSSDEDKKVSPFADTEDFTEENLGMHSIKSKNED